jgi:hypothetical protein
MDIGQHGISCPMITDVPQDILGNVRTTLTTLYHINFHRPELMSYHRHLSLLYQKLQPVVNTPIQVVITNNG